MGANPVWADPSELMVDVETPDGRTLAIDDPALTDMLRTDIDQKHQLTLMRSERAMTDCRPVSIFSLQSARQLGEETGTPIANSVFILNGMRCAATRGLTRSSPRSRQRKSKTQSGCSVKRSHAQRGK
jgi:hypothetical protein